MNKIYDVIIIGAGVIGASIARALSKYNINIRVLEKENDVGNMASCANSAIIHSGYDPVPGSLKAKLNVLGNQMFDKLQEDLDFEFRRIGSLTIASNDSEMESLKELASRAYENKVEVKILSKEEVKAIEPNINDSVVGALLAPTCGIINPFEYVVALMENAMDNGVELGLNEEVLSIKEEDSLYAITTNINKYLTKKVINASGINSAKVSEMINDKYFDIVGVRGEYFVLDHFSKNFVNHVLFNLPSKLGKGVLVSPTTHYNYIVGPSSEKVDDVFSVKTNKEVLDKVKLLAKSLVPNIPYNQVIRQFSGMRAKGFIDNHDDFIIEEVKDGFINVCGIQSPGFASSPAIALYVESLLKLDSSLIKSDYNPKRRPLIRFNELPIDVQNEKILENPEFGEVVCRCEQVTKAEIRDVIRRNCGATTIKGVKKRVRPGFGKCQGGFCESIVLKILAEELGKNYTDIDKSKKGSYILLNETKGDNHAI